MRNAPGRGEINIGEHSSLRKRMRAVRRGKMAPWWPPNKDAERKMLRRYGRKAS